MSDHKDARDGQLDQAEFKKKMLSQLQTAGVVGQLKSHLRAQLLSQLQKGKVMQLGPPPGDKPGLRRHALNSMIADYLAAVQYNYSLSVFKEESGVESRPLLTEDEVLDVLKIDRDTSFYQSYMKSKAHAGSDSSVILNLLSAISEAVAAKGKESFTQTIGGDRYQMEVRMMQLENEYQARLREARVAPGAGLEERLALYRQEIEEQAAAEVARQVERIREMEVAAARLDEAAKARRAMEAERVELDRVHSERLTKLRQREEEMMDKLRRQQRDVENVAYEHRQRILREEERLRNQKNELHQEQDLQKEKLKQFERSLELRERAVAARETAAEKKLAEATEVAAEAQVVARQDVEREYMELKGGLAHQRMQLEMDRARMQELRSEAMADLAAARAKDDRLRALETARAEAEARAAAHAADAEVCRLQAEKMALELNQAREELSRRVAQAAEGAEAMLQNAAGAMNMLNAEAMVSRHTSSQIRDVMTQLERAKEEASSASAQAAALQQERVTLQVTLAALTTEAESLRTQLRRVEALLDEAVAARATALSSLEEGQFRLFQHERELSDVRSALSRTKEELAALRMQLAMRRPPTRGSQDSPGRRSITVSPTRRPPPGAASTISALSLGIAFAGGHGGSMAATGGHGAHQHHQGHHHNHHHVHQNEQQQPLHYQTSLGVSMPGGAQASLEFPIAAAPRDPILERLERLRRQEDIVASQEDAFRKRMAILQEVRDRSLAGGTGAASSHNAVGSPVLYQHDDISPLQQIPSPELFPAVSHDSPPPYMTYVMHGSPSQGMQLYSQQQFSPRAAAETQDQSQADEEQMMLAYQQRDQHIYRQQQQQQLQHYFSRPTPFQQQEHQQVLLQEQEQQQRYAKQAQYAPSPQQEHERQTANQKHPTHFPYDDRDIQAAQQQQQVQQQQVQVSRQQTPTDGAPSGPAASAAPSASLEESLEQPSQSSSLSQPQQPQQHPPYVSARSTGHGYGTPPQQQLSTPQVPPHHTHDNSVGHHAPQASSLVSGLEGQRAIEPLPQLLFAEPTTEPASNAPPTERAVTHAQSEAMPPFGLVITSNLGPPAPEEPPQAVAEPLSAPPKPTIPGLLIVSDFSPRGAAAQEEAKPHLLMQRPEEHHAALPPPPPMDVEDVMQAKMRMLQEQRERALAAQQQQQQHPPLQRHTSRTSQSSRYSGRGSGSGEHYIGTSGNIGSVSMEASSPGTGAGMLQPHPEDSSSAIVAGEAYDTVAPELSTLQRRRQKSHEGGAGHLSRQSSVTRRELVRGVSIARSETSALSIEIPGLSGPSMKALSIAQTLDDIPSSLEGYELPGLNDDDEDVMEAPGGDEDRYGSFAAEFSAGSVF